MDAKEEFSTRLRAAMAVVGMEASGTELERAFNRRWGKTPISVQAAWNWINGKTMPRDDKLRVLAKVLRTDPIALRHGDVVPLTAAEKQRTWESQVSYAERETIEAFLHLPAPQRVVVRDVIHAFAKAYGEKE